jgi:hypothetical protein
MVADEAMAAHFYKTGDPSELADRLVTILQAPELQSYMAQRNFAAGLQMNMTSVVRNYLRWFEVHKCKRAILAGGELSLRQRLVERTFADRDGRLGWVSRHSRDAAVTGDGLEPAANDGDSAAFADPHSWRNSFATKGRSEGEGYGGSPTLEGDF